MRIAFSFLVLVLAVSKSIAQAPDDLCGIWLTEDSRGKIQIYKNTTLGTYEGKVIWQQNPNDANGKEKIDTKNPDPKLRTRSFQNMVVITGLKWDAEDKRWYDGKVYNPEDGNFYSCKARMDDKNTIFFRGYLLVSLLGKTTTWRRRYTTN